MASLRNYATPYYLEYCCGAQALFRDPARGLTSYNERMCTYNICYTVLSQVACLANSERNNPAHELPGTAQVKVPQQARGEIPVFPSHFT